MIRPRSQFRNDKLFNDTIFFQIFKIDQSRAAGRQPFLVAATAGTTVLGAIDPLRQLGFICSREKLWLHVDAAWGGGLLFSSSHKYKLDGIDS